VTIYLTDYRTASTEQVEMFDDIEYPQNVHWFPETYARKDTGLVYPPHKLADKVLDPVLLEDIKNRPGKTAFILAAGNAHFAGVPTKKVPNNQLTYDYKFLALSLTQVYAGRIAQSCGANDLVTTDSSACASSLKVMMDVVTLMRMYRFDRVVVLTLEDAVSNTVLRFFGEAKATLSREQEASGVKPSAFDKTNYGFRIGQGAAFAVFEREGLATQPRARLLGAYSASEESTNSIGQRDDGQGFIRAAQGALQSAYTLPIEIDVIKTHGTGTLSNNKSERTAIEAFMTTPFVATSFKQRIGHTMGASGLLETCLLLDHMSKGVVPEILNRTEKDEVYLSEPAEAKPKSTILSLAAGMGNIYSAAIFSTDI
jgi:3-oxoacyl-(acyl-carrier-protein) synthase